MPPTTEGLDGCARMGERRKSRTSRVTMRVAPHAWAAATGSASSKSDRGRDVAWWKAPVSTVPPP